MLISLLLNVDARCFAVQHVEDISDVSLASEDDKNNSDKIECALEIVEMEFFHVTVATDDHNEDSVSRVNKNKNVKKIKAVTTNKIFNDVTKTKWAEATDTCQISDVKCGYSINEDFQNL